MEIAKSISEEDIVALGKKLSNTYSRWIYRLCADSIGIDGDLNEADVLVLADFFKKQREKRNG